VPLDQVVERVISDVKSLVDRAAIDVVVATHRHRDHVQGFDNPAWTEVEVGEVWLPWTESPNDPIARNLRERQSKRALQLAELAVDAKGERWAAVRALTDNSLKNAEAMAMLHYGFSGDPPRFFLPEVVEPDKNDARSRTFMTTALPNTTIHILGPSRDERIIRDIEPPPGKSYLRAGKGGADLKRTGANPPFDPFLVSTHAYHQRYQYLGLKSEGSVVTAGRTDALAAAAALEQAVNGTSLVLAIEYRGMLLLFPGDAQWGTWRAALDDPEMRAVLDRTDLYKVGHHGSYNATPREFVEGCLHHAQFAMVPVGRTSLKSFDSIPRPQLLDAMGLPERCGQVLCSNAPPAQAPDRVALDPMWLEVEVVRGRER
jgi:hypothetical protein